MARHILCFMQEGTNCQPAKKTAHEDGYDGIRGTESVMLVNTYKKQR
ncbi:hypothetical protein HFM99_06505 [Lacrimispora celerecrescens]|nr:hypothetical protein [Lacrimispora celerecrescens]